jgi:hypothetical protein
MQSRDKPNRVWLGLSENEWKGLWAVLWRVLLLGPIVGLLGLAWLLVVSAAVIAPPLYAAFALFSGDGLFGIAALVGWFTLLRFGRPLFRWTLQGIEYGSL